MGIYDLVVIRIRQLCEERGVTPNGLSYISGVSQSTIKSILCGEHAEKAVRRARNIDC